MEVVQIDKKTAQDFFKEYEHLGNCGLGVWHFGCYDHGLLVSVVSFGTACFNPNRSKIGKYAFEHNMRVIQLNRGGTRYDAPRNTASAAVALALKKVRELFGDTIIVAYSDTKWNEIGTIYQSTNFMYFGLTEPKGQSNYIINGRTLSGWTVRKKYGTRDMNKLSSRFDNVVRVPITPKHLYVYVNSSALNKRRAVEFFEDYIKPYPSRKELGVGSMLKIRERNNS